MNGWLIFLGLCGVILLLAWVVRRAERAMGGSGNRRPSGVRGLLPVCSQGELAFLRVLEDVVPAEMRVLCKVRVADVIDTFGADFRTVSQKHFDFVVCDANDFTPRLVIELDDKSHLTATAMKADAVKNEMCARAGLRMLRVKAAANYDGPALARAVRAELAAG
jgi:hypothetical protein